MYMYVATVVDWLIWWVITILLSWWSGALLVSVSSLCYYHVHSQKIWWGIKFGSFGCPPVLPPVLKVTLVWWSFTKMSNSNLPISGLHTGFFLEGGKILCAACKNFYPLLLKIHISYWSFSTTISQFMCTVTISMILFCFTTRATSLVPRLSFLLGGRGKESLVHTVCACTKISVKVSVKLSGYY